MTNNTIFETFGIKTVNTLSDGEKYSAKNSREKCETALKSYIADNNDTAPSWVAFCEICNRYAGVFPSKALYVLAFGEDKAKKLWVDTEARFIGLQAMTATYADELGSCSAEKNKSRRGLIGEAIKGVYAYLHRVCPYEEIPKKAISTIGEYALKYAYIDWDNATSRAQGISAFIKITLSTIEGYGKKEEALSALKDKAFRLAQKAQIAADNDEHWLDKP